MEIGAIFAPTKDTASHIELAEKLGYAHAFVYDSPSFLADPWMVLAQAAPQTSAIQLGVSVVTPRLRHVVATAGALATLRAMAPGRVIVVVGTGFTSQLMIGKAPATWAEVETYVHTLRELLAGEEVEWDGAVIGLKHGRLSGLKSTVPIPIWVAAHGPKGHLSAQRVADGIVTNLTHGAQNELEAASRTFVLYYGTVLDPGEDAGSPRVVDAAGATAAFQLHIGAEGVVGGTPEWARYERAIHSIPERRRHLETHSGHLIEVSDLERPLITPELILQATETRDAAGTKVRVDELERSGVAGVLYGPQGSDVPRELRTFAEAVELKSR